MPCGPWVLHLKFEPKKFTCRYCEKISQPPAPFHTIPRGWAGPQLIAMVAFDKYGQHQPLNRQFERIAREGIDLSLSTLADLIGHACVALAPIHELIETHVLAAARLHGDDTTVPLLARGGTKTARLWTYVRDDRPWGGGAPPAALFKFSRDRQMIHPNKHLAGWQGILQADAYSGYKRSLSGRPSSRACAQRLMLEPCAAQVLRTGRHRGQRAQKQARA